MNRPSLALASALAVPLLVTGCSGGSSPSAKPSTSPSTAASQTADPNFYVASGYFVTEPDSVSRKELNGQFTMFSSLPGVNGVSVAGAHKLEVDVAFTITRAQRDALVAKMRTLGSVSTVPVMPHS